MLHEANSVSREAFQFQHGDVDKIQHPDNLTNAGYYYNSAGQLYPDSQGVHNIPGEAEAYPTQNYNNTQVQPTFRRTQLDPPVIAHVQGNCCWC